MSCRLARSTPGSLWWLQRLPLVAALCLSACSTYQPWINAPLPTAAEPAAGVAEARLPASPASTAVPPAATPAAVPQAVRVAITLSGGGARAAAFGLGVLQALKATPFDLAGRPTTLLDQVVLVSGVSGGSILAAHFAAFGDATLTRFDPDFLQVPFEAQLIRQALVPTRLYRLSSPWYGRTQVLAQRLDALYAGRTFGDVRRRPGAPELMITATDLTTGAPFDFTPEQFQVICSDLDSTPLSFAAAASSAVPLLLSPVTVRNHAGRCVPQGAHRAGVVDPAASNYRARLLQRSAEGYRNAAERPYIHLVDGGVTDNLGVRLMLDRLVAGGAMSSSFADAPDGSIRRLVLVTVNSERGLAERVDSSDRVPSTSQVLESLIFGAASRETEVTLALLQDDLQRWREELMRTRGQPGSPFAADAELHAIGVSLHDVQDERLRHQLLRVPTAFTIESGDVRALQHAGAAALRSSEAFERLRQSLPALAASLPAQIPAQPRTVPLPHPEPHDDPPMHRAPGALPAGLQPPAGVDEHRTVGR